VKDRTIYSPTSRAILQGVSLQTVRELAPQLGLEFEEMDLQPYDVINADEAWLTSTPFSIAPVTRINNIPIGKGVIGPLFREMVQAWSDLVGVNILGQILEP
jgi:branched-chain amino acid aminotransferase